MQSILQYRRLAACEPPKQANTNTEPVISNESTKSDAIRDDSDNSEVVKEKEVRTPSSTGVGDVGPLVDWDGPEDPLRPRNWSLAYRVWIALIIWINVFVLDWASAADSRDGDKIVADFGVSKVAESLDSALYVIGIATGALFAGPIAESVGRNPIYVFSRMIHVAFTLGAALAPNLAGLIVCRFLAGLGASVILAIHGASIADLFGAQGRCVAWPFVATGSFFGTLFAPVVGGWLANNESISWRWTEWITLILTALNLLLNVLALPETFAPILLSWKAAHLRRKTGDSRYLSELDLQDSMAQKLKASFHRALLMTTREPIVMFLGLWLVIVYIVVFGFLQGFEFIYEDTYDFSEGLLGTAFLAIALGITLFTALAPPFGKLHSKQQIQWHSKHGQGADLPPEYRLIPGFIVAPLFPISMFWLGWTNYKSISVWSNLGATTLFGFVWAGIYVVVYQYILDVYGIYAGSALATITFLRYIAAGAMVVISRPIYENLGVHYTLTLLGCLAFALMPAPYIFWRFGTTVRQKSHFASKEMLPDGSEVHGAQPV